MRNARALGLVLVSVLLVAACGGDDDSKVAAGPSTSTSTASTTTSTTTGPASTDPAMRAKAEAAVLQAGDFPPGWETQPPEEGLDLEIVWRDLMDCTGVAAGQPSLGIATSPTFLRDLATQARSTVEYTTETSAQAIAAAVAGPTFTECAKTAFLEDAKRSAPDGGVPTPVEVAPLDFPVPGHTASAFRITNTMNLDDLPVPISQDFLVFFRGGTVTRLVFLNPGGPFPQDLERSLVEKVVGRV